MVDQADFAVNIVPPQENSRDTERVAIRQYSNELWRVFARGCARNWKLCCRPLLVHGARLFQLPHFLF